MKLINAPVILAGRPALLVSGLLVVLLAVGTLLGGCGGGSPHPPGSYERAMYYLEREKNLEAVAAFESFVRHNPTDDRAPEAQYQKSMLYIEMEEYPLAAVEFQILRKDYPTSDRVEDSLFHEGVSYFRQVGKVQRDITGALEARKHFMSFVESYPASQYIPQVRDYLTEISDLAVRKRLQQAKVFWQLKRYEAVKMTLGTALEDESGSSLLDRVLWQRGRACEKLDDNDEALRMYERLLSAYPDSDFRDRAQSAIKNIKEGPEPPEDVES